MSPDLEPVVFTYAAAIVFAENECVETYFPANNPIPGAQEIYVRNPLTPLDPESFWSSVVRPSLITGAVPAADILIEAVDNVFASWSAVLGDRAELAIGYSARYFVDNRPLTRAAGLVQIRDYASEQQVEALRRPLGVLVNSLKTAKAQLHEIVTAPSGLNYFQPASEPKSRAQRPTHFDEVLSRRLALAGLIVKELHDERNFGRTKLAKVFYLSDKNAELQLETNYVREAAGPLDQRALYNDRVGIEALALKHQMFKTSNRRKMIRYDPLSQIQDVESLAQKHMGEKLSKVLHVIDACRSLSTEQSEIVATLHACWNDFLVKGQRPTDEIIVNEFLENWHPKKARFPRTRLLNALRWMRKQGLSPLGRGTVTQTRNDNRDY